MEAVKKYGLLVALALVTLIFIAGDENVRIYLGYTLTIIGAAGAIVAPLVSSLSNPSALIKTGINLAVLLVLFGICYAVADNTVLPSYEKFGITPSGSKFVGGLLVTMYALIGLAGLGIIANEITKMIKS